MNSRKLTYAESFPVEPEQVFAALIKPSAIRAWWSASTVLVIPTNDGIWSAAWGSDEDNPEYVTAHRISACDPPRRMSWDQTRYLAPPGAPTPKGAIVTEFLLVAEDLGTKLTVTQSGFDSNPEGDNWFAGCEQGWVSTFQSLRKYLDEEAAIR